MKFENGVYRASVDGCGFEKNEVVLRKVDDHVWEIFIPENKTPQWALNRLLLAPDSLVLYQVPGAAHGFPLELIKKELRKFISTGLEVSHITLPGVDPGSLSWFFRLLPWDLEEAAQHWIDHFYSRNAIPSGIPPADKRVWMQSKPHTDSDKRIVVFKSKPNDGSKSYELKIVMYRRGAHWIPTTVAVSDRVWVYDPKENRLFRLVS